MQKLNSLELSRRIVTRGIALIHVRDVEVYLKSVPFLLIFTAFNFVFNFGICSVMITLDYI